MKIFLFIIVNNTDYVAAFTEKLLRARPASWRDVFAVLTSGRTQSRTWTSTDTWTDEPDNVSELLNQKMAFGEVS
jgi:hypothetical protein